MKTAEMTMEQLRQAARDHDNIHNEGGEGYNPYREEIAQRLRAEAAARPKTRKDRIDDLYRRLRVECGSVARESRRAEAVDALAADIRSQIAALEAEADAEFLAAWPADTTEARRQTWNALARSGKIKTMRDARAQESEQGWTMDDLKRAVALHKVG